MGLTKAYEKLALQLQEAATELSHSDIHKALSDQLNDMHPNDYCYVMDTYGDDSSGDVVYQHKGQTYKAPYSLGTMNGKRTAEIDEDSKANVVPRTVYDEEADDEDNYTGMNEAATTEAKSMTKETRRMVFGERFISKDERAGADAADFAGKGKSFPILKPADVMAAVRSMGRAGSDNSGTGTLKKNIIAIAKRKGWTKYLPKAWQGSMSADEAARTTSESSLKLMESAAGFLDELKIREARTDYPIKIISPGTGSTAHYPAKVLEKSAGLFKPGTLMFWNHPTGAEEAARPEGNLDDLAAITTSAAEYMESGPRGPGLYAKAKVMADYAQKVEERAPHIGLSIRAGGTTTGRMVDGKPELKSIDHVESVDYVTKAGRGGLALAEAASYLQLEEHSEKEADEMTAAEVQKLVEAGVRVATLPTRMRESAARLLATVTLPTLAKERIIERAVSAVDVSKDFDEKAFGELIAKEAQAEGRYLAEITGSGRVIGMGSTSVPLTEADEKAAKKEKKALKEQKREAVDVFESLMGDRKAAKFAAEGRV